jgi:hypothetical protein
MEVEAAEDSAAVEEVEVVKEVAVVVRLAAMAALNVVNKVTFQENVHQVDFYA